MRQETLDVLADRAPFTFPLNLTDPEAPKYLAPQAEFVHDWSARFRAYGGGLGNGKTSAGCAIAFYLSYCFPGNRGFIGRWDGKELRQTTMTDFRELIPAHFFEKSNDQMGYLKFKRQYGGSEILYGDLKETRAIKNYNLGWFWLDQAEELDGDRWDLLVSRLRKQTPLLGEDGHPMVGPDQTPLMAPTFGLATFNPEGTVNWIWRYFHPDSPDKKPGYGLYQATTYQGLSAGFITQEYVDGMLALFPEASRKRYLEGSWEMFEGRVYPGFEPALHVIDPIPLQPHWKYYLSIDHGLTNPTAIQVWARTETGLSLLIGEHYEGGGKPVSYHAACAKNLIRQVGFPVPLIYLDPSCWAKNQSEGRHVFSVADEYAEHGLLCVPGQNNWEAGYNRCTELLRVDPTLIHPVTGKPGCPTVLIFSTCPMYISEKLNYRWKKVRGTSQQNEPDEPIDYHDHHMDAERYFFAARPADALDPITSRPEAALEIVQRHIRTWNPLQDPKPAGGWMSW